MSGIQIDALPHKTKDCNTKKGLKVFAQDDGSVNGYCFACNSFIENPYGEAKTVSDLPPRKEKTPKQIQEEIAEVDGYPTVDVEARLLRANTLDKFGAKVSLSEYDGETPTAIYWPVTKGGKLTGYHVKTISGYKFNIGDTKEADLLNWQNVHQAYRIIITEGPEDMASVDRAFERYGDPEYIPFVTSLPRGASSATKVLTKHAKEIRRLFKEVILAFDDDEAGRKATKEAMLIFPEAKSVVLPEKDANAMVLAGRMKEMYKLFAFNATTPVNTRLVLGRDIHKLAMVPASYGELTWPWEQMQEDLRGVRLGETLYIGAGVKSGKSTLRNALAAHWMKNDGAVVFKACPEETNTKSYKKLATHLTGHIFDDPKIEFNEEAYEEAGKILQEKLLMLDLYQHLGWPTLKEDIRVAVNDFGAKVVMIDPITNLTNGGDPTTVNSFLQGFAQEISAMAMDMNFLAVMFCHLNTPEGQISDEQRQRAYAKEKYWDLGNCSHEYGGSIYSTQFAGSRGMMRSCNLMLALKANKDVHLPSRIQNTRWLTVLEDREFNNNTEYELFYNRQTGLFEEQ